MAATCWFLVCTRVSQSRVGFYDRCSPRSILSASCRPAYVAWLLRGDSRRGSSCLSGLFVAGNLGLGVIRFHDRD